MGATRKLGRTCMHPCVAQWASCSDLTSRVYVRRVSHAPTRRLWQPHSHQDAGPTGGACGETGSALQGCPAASPRLTVTAR